MANIRDPAFWRRFSVAVHLDEEAKGNLAAPSPLDPSTTAEKSIRSAASSTTSIRPPLKHSESWLERQHKKRRRVQVICWILIALFCLLAVAIGILGWWMSRSKKKIV